MNNYCCSIITYHNYCRIISKTPIDSGLVYSSPRDKVSVKNAPLIPFLCASLGDFSSLDGHKKAAMNASRFM